MNDRQALHEKIENQEGEEEEEEVSTIRVFCLNYTCVYMPVYN
jgi:hypothetical protein